MDYIERKSSEAADVDVGRLLEMARQHHEAGHRAEAEAVYLRILEREPRNAAALHELGMLAFLAGKLEVALGFMERASAAAPAAADYVCNLGAILEKMGRKEQAEHAYRWAIQINPKYRIAHNNLGNLLCAKGDYENALAEVQCALDLQPHYVEAIFNRANILKAMRRFEQAAADFRVVCLQRPQAIKAWVGLTQSLQYQGKIHEAVEAARQTLRRWPNRPRFRESLGHMLVQIDEPIEAVSEFKKALELNPNLASAHNGLGLVQQNLGQMEQAVESFRAAQRLQPENASYHSDLLYALLLSPDDEPRKIADEHKEWNRRHARPLAQFIRSHENDRSPDRRLRIGYVSADLYFHVLGRAIMPLLQRHDRQQFEVFCYSNVAQPDATTDRIRQATDQWRSIFGASDESAAELIRQDKIDILVDLSMHTQGNRLTLFARKPAPVQATYLAFCGATGLEAIDYRFSDRFIDPPDADLSIYSEKTIRLPDCYWSYDPGEDVAEVSPLPALQAGFVTFGSLNNLRKVPAPCMDLWIRLIAGTPHSRMLMLSHEGAYANDIRQRFARAGVDPARVEFVGYQPRADYFRTFSRIDICLDPFPYNGGVTTCNSLWMGVPVVTLAGRTSVGRAGASILNNVGLPELVAATQDKYFQIALDLAGDINRLSELRLDLRPMMQRSPLLDIPRHVRNIEAAYQQMWRTWCQRR